MRMVSPKNLPISAFYKKCLQENGYSVSSFKKSYVKKLRELVKKFGENNARLRIKLMVKYFDDIKEEFVYLPVTKLNFPHPDLFYNEEVWNFVKGFAKKTIKITGKPIPELYNEIYELIKKKDKEAIIRLGEKYGKERVLATVARVYSMYGKKGDKFFAEIYYDFIQGRG